MFTGMWLLLFIKIQIMAAGLCLMKLFNEKSCKMRIYLQVCKDFCIWWHNTVCLWADECGPSHLKQLGVSPCGLVEAWIIIIKKKV